MDIRKVKKLIDLLEESGIAEIEISEGEESVRISRYPQGMTVAHGVPMPAMAAPASPAAPRAEAPASPPPATPAPATDKSITAPMVGTFYSSPAPGAKPFVQVGDEIKVGQVLCIIEAMKMMNQIESEKEGRVVSVLARNGEPVEFGQPLYVLE
ncbi:MAG TPA: acetyl-CoA carboxylase biotin carboxyl carrier protein [Hyphomicrobiales bacterium]|nr:acetyl-CoA carboxylase biotin carboxyl carrier protein [Hyphomicrobiales bacterium]